MEEEPVHDLRAFCTTQKIAIGEKRMIVTSGLVKFWALQAMGYLLVSGGEQ